MEKILIFGHKSPDTDSITSSLVMENFEKKLGNDNVKACRLGEINKETQYVLNYLGIEAPELISDVEDGQDVILVDHNSFLQTVPNIEKANILKVIDHHCISDFCIKYPTYVRTEAIGCTESILYKLYKENNVEIDKKIATLMLSAIISDTLLFKSPTCTKEDIEIANELAKIAELDANTYGLDMLKAGTDLTGFSAKDILFIDAKETSLKDVKSIIAQVNTACIDDVMKFKTDLEAEMNKIIEEKDLGLFVLAITDIINSNSQAIVLGKRADIVEKSYNVTLENNTALLKGVVSRKKQMVPIMTENA